MRNVGPTGCPSAARGRGFSLLELVVVISITAILAATAIPRFVEVKGFSSRGFHDEALGVVRHAQKTAIAWRREIFVCVSASSIAAAAAAGCATPLPHPATGAPLVSSAPSGVTLSPVNFRFNAIGRLIDNAGNPSAAAITVAFTSTIAGDPARQIVIEPETGYVHP